MPDVPRLTVGQTKADLLGADHRAHNPPMDGCRGAGLFLYRGFGTAIEHCAVRNFNGDGFSFQQSNDVLLNDCVSENNASLGLHPGSGSQRGKSATELNSWQPSNKRDAIVNRSLQTIKTIAVQGRSKKHFPNQFAMRCRNWG